MNFFNNLKKKINKKTAAVCIVGVGYVGSELIKSFSNAGYYTIGLDIKKKKTNQIKFNSKKVLLTTNYEKIKGSDIIIITLPTPLSRGKNPDLSYLKKSLKSMQKYIRKGQFISLESTSYPGTTRQLFVPFLKKLGFILGENIFLSYSPERLSPELKIKSKEIKYKFKNTPKIYSGYSKKCSNLAKIIYNKIVVKTVLANSFEIAETAKMIENTFRSVNIGLVNELKMFLSKIKIDIHESLDLADTKPFGFTRFDPGPGYGGHCIPVDPFYLYWLAKKNNFKLNFIKTAGDVNEKVIKWVSGKLIAFVKKNPSFRKKKVLILGVAYKPDIDDCRESPAFKIIDLLKRNDIDYEYSDPYVKKINLYNKIKKSKKISANLLRSHPIVLIVTNHTKFNYDLITKKAKFIFDTRNSIKNRTKNYIKL